MSRPFWIAAYSGAAVTAALIMEWSPGQIEAKIILATYIWAIFALAYIDVWRTRW